MLEISKEDADFMLDNKDNLINILNDENVLNQVIDNGVSINRGESNRVHTGTSGKVKGDVNIPPIFREIIGIQANVSGVPQKSLADTWGISQPQVSNIKDGRTNGTTVIEKDGLRESDIQLGKALDTSLGMIREKVTSRIIKSLDFMIDEKLEDLTAKELSIVTSNLSRVLISATPKEKSNLNLNVQTVFYSPKTETVEQYDVLDV